MDRFVIEKPRSLNELVHCLKLSDENTWILSGGTDLVIRFRNQGIYHGRLIDMTCMETLRYIRLEDGQIKIGANTTFSEIAENELVQRHATCLAEAAGSVGSKQIQNTARMAGNIANSSPRGDSIPALLALDARIITINGWGEKASKSIEELVIDIGRNTLKRDEAIIEIQLPFSMYGHKSAFAKQCRESSRSTVIISNVNLAAVLEFDKKSNTILKAGVVIGSAAPVAYHAVEAERLLTGKAPTEELREAFAEALRQHVLESIKGNKRYQNKLDAVRGLGLTVFDRIIEGAQLEKLPAGGDR